MCMSQRVGSLARSRGAVVNTGLWVRNVHMHNTGTTQEL